MDAPMRAPTKADDPEDLESRGITRRVLEFDVLAAPPSHNLRMSQVIRVLTPELFTRSASSKKKLRDTAYLDGVRGLAALIVYFAHNLLSTVHLMTPLEVAFGYNGQHHYLINFPFLRIFFTGSHVAVPIFFVISGYVQARKPITQIHGNHDIADTLASAIFRRWFRLFIPLIGSTFVFMTTWHLLGLTPTLDHHETAWTSDVVYYLKDLWYWTNPFRTKNADYFHDHKGIQTAWFAYNGHSWTIPVEYQGSIVLLLTLFTLSKVTTGARVAIMTTMAIYFLVQANPYLFTFLIGGVIADLELASNSLLSGLRSSRYRMHISYALLAVGCYLGTPPALGLNYMSSELMSTQPGWHYLTKLAPWVYLDTIHFFVSIAAVMIVVAIMSLPSLQKFFEMRVLQYLGRISFALYLVHGPILETLGSTMYLIVGKKSQDPPAWYENAIPVPNVGPIGIDTKFFVANLVILPITLYVAEVFMRLFDENSVHIAQSIYQGILR